MRLKSLAPVAALAPLTLALLACAPADQKSTVTQVDSCATQDLAVRTPGTLTIGTDSPAYPPWFEDNKPANGKGFESAVAYAVADQLGFTNDQVTWVKVPFNNSYAPGEKKFDFDINQISITPARAKVVDFSDGYYSAAQAVIALKTEAGHASTLADLKGLKLGAQTGTTSLTAIRDDIQPSQQPLVFDNTNAAKQALLNGQVDAIVADLPTAFYITAVEIPQGTITGQFEATGAPEEFGLLMQKGSELLPCVNKALGTLKTDGTLDTIQTKWLSDVVDVPVLK
jgi:polar amino acid transport system substrate-binding protein